MKWQKSRFLRLMLCFTSALSESWLVLRFIVPVSSFLSDAVIILPPRSLWHVHFPLQQRRRVKISGSRAESAENDAAPITHPVFVKWYCLNYYLMRLVTGRDLLMKDSVAWQNVISVFLVPRHVPQVQRLPAENVVQSKKYRSDANFRIFYSLIARVPRTATFSWFQ